MSRFAKWGAWSLSAVLFASVLSACAQPKGSSAPPAAAGPSTQPAPGAAWDGTLTIGLPSNPTSLDPRVTLDGIAKTIYYNAYEYLVVVKPGTTSDLVGDLADSFTASADGKQWTFKLKPGHKFWDGTPVDSGAVKFTFESMLKINQGPASDFRTIKEIQTPDAQTVTFVLTEPFSIFPNLLTDIGIVNPKVMEQEKGGDYGSGYLSQNLMGSGPYRLADWKPNQSVVLEAVPEYWGTQPKAKKVVFPIFTELSNLRLQLEKGDLDIAWGIPTDQMMSMFNKPGIKVQDNVGFDFIYVYLNNQKKPLDNAKVRQALSYATDYDTIVNDLLQGHGKQLKGPYAFAAEGYKEPAFYYKRDLGKARQLLAEAGLPNGFTFTLLYASPTVGAAQAAQVLQANFAEIGVKVQLQEIAEATRRERVDKGDFEASMGQWVKTAQPYWTLNVWHDSSRFGLAGDRSFYKNPQVDDLLRKAVAEMDATKRADTYRQAQDLIMQDAPYIYLYQRNSMLPMRDSVKGYLYNPVPYRINLPDLSK
jgi:peptide/nickel transport system substrate-binding protein